MPFRGEFVPWRFRQVCSARHRIIRQPDDDWGGRRRRPRPRSAVAQRSAPWLFLRAVDVPGCGGSCLSGDQRSISTDDGGRKKDIKNPYYDISMEWHRNSSTSVPTLCKVRDELGEYEEADNLSRSPQRPGSCRAWDANVLGSSGPHKARFCALTDTPKRSPGHGRDRRIIDVRQMTPVHERSVFTTSTTATRDRLRAFRLGVWDW